MPIFEYECKTCRHTFERIVFRPVDRIECPKCGYTETEQLISSFAVTGGTGRRSGPAARDCGPSGMG